MAKTNMYYEDNRDLAHDEKELSISLLGLPMRFMTDAGVFSKSAIDYGTRVLIDNFEPGQAKSLLDVGCGYGAMGLPLAKKHGLALTMVDVNSRALELAEKNALLNQVAVESIKLSDQYEALAGETFDSIVSNPPIRAGKEVVHGILSGAIDHLNPQGHLTIVIQKKQGAPSAQKKMLEVFGNCELVAKDKGYWILRSVKS
ncbi:class I SAM-dependent methyltransferase [Lactococcus termiticola]|nr:class I SAM-dependent methyltransferase [Lactococcus termiticola]